MYVSFVSLSLSLSLSPPLSPSLLAEAQWMYTVWMTVLVYGLYLTHSNSLNNSFQVHIHVHVVVYSNTSTCNLGIKLCNLHMTA